MLPDVEKLLVAYLAADSSVTALTSSIGTRIPPSTDLPWVRLTLLDTFPDRTSPALHAASAMVQLDCYGGQNRDLAQGQASALARIVQAALHALPGVHSGAVVASVKTTGPRRLPDPNMKPPRERYLLTATITLHP